MVGQCETLAVQWYLYYDEKRISTVHVGQDLRVLVLVVLIQGTLECEIIPRDPGFWLTRVQLSE